MSSGSNRRRSSTPGPPRENRSEGASSWAGGTTWSGGSVNRDNRSESFPRNNRSDRSHRSDRSDRSHRSQRSHHSRHSSYVSEPPETPFTVGHEDSDIWYVDRSKELIDSLPVKYETGQALHKWIKTGADPKFDDPTPMADSASQSEKAKYNAEYKRAGDKNDKLARDKSSLCSDILKDCSEDLRGMLEEMENPSLDDIIAEGKAKELLECVRDFIMGTKDNGTVPKHWMRMKLWKKMADCKIKSGRSLDQHYRVFTARVEALEAAVGKLRAVQDSRLNAGEQDIAANKMKAMFFLDSLGSRYNKVVLDMHRDYARSGNEDVFPKTPAAALRIVKSHYRHEPSYQADFMHAVHEDESVGSISDHS